MPKYPITVLVAVKNEEANIASCLDSLVQAERVLVIDSGSKDRTKEITLEKKAEWVEFVYQGHYPKKRQWALENSHIQTPWVMLIDADEKVPAALWDEIGKVLQIDDKGLGACIALKEFHFLGRRLRYGGFSHRAVLLFRFGRARFEQLLDGDLSGLDMEVHERVIVDGRSLTLKTPLVHEDFKGLSAYIERHNQYSTWEAALRSKALISDQYGIESIKPRLFGTVQERRRWLKRIAMKIPFESLAWFIYHYFLRLGFLEGKRGWIASCIRANYIAQVHWKMFESQL